MSVLRHTRSFQSFAMRAARGGLMSSAARRGFTLVELMVVTVVIAILASLSFTGLTAARGRAKADKTRSTIRKINEIILPLYESYTQRRVPFKPDANRIQNARNKLVAQRLRMVRDMPDTWWDTVSNTSGSFTTGLYGGGTFLLPEVATGPMRAYTLYRDSLPGLTEARYRGECLAMIILRGGVPPQEAEQFRSDEIGDTDGDGAVEFVDGWGTTIGFFRWPSNSTTNAIDPMDTMRVSGAGTPPGNTPDPAFVPLIVSAGVNKAYGYTYLDRLDWDSTDPVTKQVTRNEQPKWVRRLTANPPTYTTTQGFISTNLTTGSTSSAGILGGIVDTDQDITNLSLTR